MGVIIKKPEPDHASTHGKNIRVMRFTMVDAEKKTLSLSVWDDMIPTQGQLLEEAASTFSVVVAKRVRVGMFNGVVLNAKKGSSFTVNPPIEEAVMLKSWYDAIGHLELQNQLTTNKFVISRDLVDKGLQETHTVADLQNQTTIGDYWIRGFLNLADEEQKFYYIACNNCRSKIKAEQGHNYTCFLCKKKVVATPMPIVVMTISDHTGTIKVIAIQNLAEKILQTTAERISGLAKMGEVYDVNSIKAEFNDRFCLILLRRTPDRVNENQRRHLLMAYYDENYNPAGSQLASSSSSSNAIGKEKSVELPVSPLKRQMDQITLHSGMSPNKKQLMMTDDWLNKPESTSSDDNTAP